MKQTRFEDEKDVKRKGKELAVTILLAPSTERSSAGAVHSSSSSEYTLSRLTSSASNLTSNLLHSRAHEQHYIDPQYLSKANSSGSTQRSGTTGQETARVVHSSTSTAQLTLGSTFKSPGRQASVSGEEASFSVFLEMLKGAMEPAGRGPAQDNVSPQVTHVPLASINDGSEVVHLLESGPDTMVEGDDELHIMNKERPIIRRASIGSKPSADPASDGTLNFFPKFLSDPSGCEAYGELLQHLGVSDLNEGRRIWACQWQNVLSSYTDEVWGDLSPLVAVARQQLQDLSTSAGETALHKLDAVRRLQQILAHVRSPLR
ncbi:hypothetical protein F5Y19DRAFT_96088 [Xylariaceae sp. FL1651]|nr:hypothetical protein F5Y19DRAFT_96088 [Xylariaceae sp. FL1651]